MDAFYDFQNRIMRKTFCLFNVSILPKIILREIQTLFRMKKRAAIPELYIYFKLNAEHPVRMVYHQQHISSEVCRKRMETLECCHQSHPWRNSLCLWQISVKIKHLLRSSLYVMFDWFLFYSMNPRPLSIYSRMSKWTNTASCHSIDNTF